MIIVLCVFDVAPEDRAAFVASRAQLVETSRAEAGNLEYAISLDVAEPGRVRLTERWEDQASLDAHMAAIQAAGGAPAVVELLSRGVSVFEATPVR